jgi:uncharacterized protein YndB with AHSA1/START domain
VGTAGLPGDRREARLRGRRRGHLLHDRSGGETSHGWWRITSVDAPSSLEFTDGFAKEDGTPETELPTHHVRVRLAERHGRTRMELRFTFASLELMEQLERLGAFEGIPQAVGQMDAVLAADVEV